MPDSGIWEIEGGTSLHHLENQCWEAMARTVELADMGQLPTTRRDRWEHARDRNADWIDDHCWSETQQACLPRGAHRRKGGRERGVDHEPY